LPPLRRGSAQAGSGKTEVAMAAIEPQGDAMRRDADSMLRLPSKSIRFACTACGKCCNDTPMMSVVEAFELADVFLAGPVLRFSPLREDIFHTGHPVLEDGDSRFPVYVELHCKPIAWTRHNGRCPVLRGDNRCGIYDRRPGVCRFVPFDLHLRPDLVSRAPIAGEELARRLGFECDWSERAPVVVAPEGVVDASYRADYESARRDVTKSHALIRFIPSEVVVGALQAAKRNSRGGKPVGDVPVFFPVLVAAAVAAGFFDTDRAREILEAQVGVADALEAAAIRRKDKDERGTTKDVRDARERCRRMLANLDESIAMAASVPASNRAAPWTPRWTVLNSWVVAPPQP
jgi:Fe-S-cluster containining protein